jgi:AcrR family transcriptional regulator
MATVPGAEKTGVGLRERKKERTRQVIADAARQLFLARGFDHVTVAEIAREADVAVKTVFNYFPAKEDLVYSRLESFEAELLAAVRERKPGESALEAFASFVLMARGYLAREDASDDLRAISHMITSSPALLTRERQILDSYTASLAALLAEETGAAEDDVEPWIAANALMGVHRALIDYVRGRSLAGVDNRRLASAARAQGRRAIASLERGFGSYAVKAS